MRALTIVIFLIQMITIGHSQSIEELINEVNTDEVFQFIRDLTGEDSTIVDNQKVLIDHRINRLGNELAAEYIKEQLESYNLNIKEIDYSSDGKNIIATKLGTVNPDIIYIICGHYDATTKYCADDNATGVSTLLESAKIMADYDFENTVIFGFWDEEETGLHGATNYANTARTNNDSIIAVLNVDMIGYDGDGDKLIDLDVRDIASSYEIKDDLISLVEELDLDINISVVDPGTLLSDHSSFWNVGYSSILLGEAWSKDDYNPHYHSEQDRINLLNPDYLINNVKLSLAYISSKGVLTGPSSTIKSNKHIATAIYPNPANGIVKIEDIEKTSIKLYDEKGGILKITIANDNTIDISNLKTGIYILEITYESGIIEHHKLTKI